MSNLYNPNEMQINIPPYYNNAMSEPFEKPETFVRETPKVGRNSLCSCGSNKKYKKCCYLKEN